MRAAAALRARARPPALPAPPARPPRAPAPARCRSLSALQRLALQILVMKLVAELVTFRGEIANVLGGRRGLDGHLFDHLEPEPFDAGDLLRVVREDADRRQAEVGEDLVADPVVAHVGLESELEVRLDGVEPVLLQLVRPQLVQQSDPAALLRHVQKNTTLLGRDLRQRLLELLAAVAAQRVEHVAGEALGMDAHEHVLGSVDLALDERDVVLARQLLAEGNRREIPVGRRQLHRRHALDEPLVAAAVLDQVGDGDELQPMPLAIRNQVGDAGHRPVLLHDLAHNARRDQAGEAREVDRRLRLPRPFQHTAVAGAERKDVARLDEILAFRLRIDRDLDRARAVGRGNAGRHSCARLDRHGERRAVGRFVVLRHLPQPELLAAVRCQAQADQPAGLLRHEVDRLGRRELRGDRQVALVLAVGRVDDDHELALPDVLDRLLDRGETASLLDFHASDRSSRSTYFARTSVSRLTLSPGSSAPSVVTSSVCGTRATANPRSSSPATVSETPSIAIEPFSTTYRRTAGSASNHTGSPTERTVPTP